MKRNGKRILCTGMIMMLLFEVWTILIQTVDVQTAGQNGTDIGFAALNVWFHKTTGVHMRVYTVTDWLGPVPIAICLIFGAVGLVQLVGQRSLLKVDTDILLLGLYYIFVIFGYLIFEMIPINYRPVLIEGRMEAAKWRPLTENIDTGYPVLHECGIGCGEVHREVNLYQEQPLAGGCFIIHIRFADKEKSILLESFLSSLLCAVKNLRLQADCSKSLSGVFHDHGFNSIRYILAGISALFKR